MDMVIIKPKGMSGAELAAYLNANIPSDKKHLLDKAEVIEDLMGASKHPIFTTRPPPFDIRACGGFLPPQYPGEWPDPIVSATGKE